jgi:hypothetical protein
MGRFRVTIGGLIGLVAFVALSFAALRDGSAAWDRAAFGSILLALLVGALLAIHREGRSRSFWLGFVLFGAVYLALAQVKEIRGRLATDWALARLDRLRPIETLDLSKPIPPHEEARFFEGDGFTRPGVTLGFDQTRGVFRATSGSTPEFYYPIGHSLWAMVLGVAGGFLSRRIFDDRHRSGSRTAPEGPGG